MQFGDFQKGIVDLLSTLKARNQDLEEVGELFMKYDTDNNGFLDQKEFKKWMADTKKSDKDLDV